jgi:hypothetical protein
LRRVRISDGEERKCPVDGVVFLAWSRPAAIEEAHDLRITVERDQVVLVSLGETT